MIEPHAGTLDILCAGTTTPDLLFLGVTNPVTFLGVEITGGSTVGYQSLFDRALRWGLGLHSGPTLPEDGIVDDIIGWLHLCVFSDPLTEDGTVDMVATGLHPGGDCGSLPEDGTRGEVAKGAAATAPHPFNLGDIATGTFWTGIKTDAF